jgi:hypothetical protein
MQRAITGIALDVLEHATLPRSTVQTPFVWNTADDGWRDAFARVDGSNREALRRAGEKRRAAQQRKRGAKAGGEG